MTAVKHAFTELPTIDIRDLAGDDLARRQAVADAIGRAAREVGFFYITGHGIDPALIAGVREAAKQIFALPMEEKMNYYIGHSKSHKGYVPEGEEIYGSGKPDHKEAFDIDFQAADDHPTPTTSPRPGCRKPRRPEAGRQLPCRPRHSPARARRLPCSSSDDTPHRWSRYPKL